MEPQPLPTDRGILLGEIRSLLKQVIGTQVEVADYTVGNQKPDYLVLLVKLRHPHLDVVIKLAGPNAPLACQFERISALHKLVARHTDIFMPEVIAADSSYRTWPWRYFIRMTIPGQEWSLARQQMSVKDVAEAYAQIGDAIAQLHSISFPLFGELTDDAHVQDGASYLIALRNKAHNSIKELKLLETFLSLFDENTDLFVDISNPVLCHEDLHKHNILFQNHQGRWQLATILDFDKAWAGCAETDLARLEFWDGMTSAEFWHSYKVKQTISPLYQQRRLIYQLLWCFEYANPSEKHLRDTNQVCRRLGLPPISRFR